MVNVLDEYEAIRAELLEDREINRLSFRRQATLLGVPFQTLHAFCAGQIGISTNNEFKAALLRRFPQLKGRLAQISLSWMDDVQPVASAARDPPVPKR